MLQSFVKTSPRLFQHFGYLETSGQSSSLKATGYKGYNLSIYLCNRTQKNVVRIGYVGRFNAAPRFSPDGSEIAFSTWVDNRFDIYRIGSDGKKNRRILNRSS